LLICVPDFDFFVEGKTGNATFPALPSGTTVYIIAPTSEYNLTYTMNGQYLAVKTSKNRNI